MIGPMSPGAGAPSPGAPESRGLTVSGSERVRLRLSASRQIVLRRRGLLLAAAATAALAGCSIRLEDDAPSLPLLQRKSMPDEKELIAGFTLATSLTQMAGRIPGAPALVSQLSGIHETQAKVLHALLARGGVPDHDIQSTAATGTATTATATAAVSAPPPASVQLLAGTEATAVAPAALAGVAAATAANRMVLTAIAAQRACAVAVLGTTVAWPTADPLPPAAAAGLLDATRSVAYAFEVVAAQLGADARPAALDTLSQLRARERDLSSMAGESAASVPLGYTLPFAVTTPELARSLAGVVLTQLVAGGLGPVPTLPSTGTALTVLVRLQAEAQSLAHGWGVAMVPFPGMAYP